MRFRESSSCVAASGILFLAVVLAWGVASAAPARFARARPNPGFTPGCYTLESDEDCGENQISDVIICVDEDGNDGDPCIVLETIAAETSKCVATASAGSDRCQLDEELACAQRIDGHCDGATCVYTSSLGPCCPTAILTGLSCGADDASAVDH